MRAGIRRRLLAAGLLVALAGCAVATQERPVRIDPDDVPFDLLEESPAGEPQPTSPTGAPGTTGAP